MELHSTTAHELALLLQKRKISSTELTKTVLERIEKVEPRVNAYITLTPELAMRMAQDADQRLQKGTLSLLLQAFHWRLRIICAPEGFSLLAPPESCIISFLLTMLQLLRSSETRVPCLWGKRTSMNSPWAHQQKIQP